MGDKSSIEWCDATWNPIRGCSRVSEGCRNCYAERVAARFSGVLINGTRDTSAPYYGLAKSTPSGPRWTGEVRFVEAALDLPLRWKTPRRIFVTSMSDAHHERVPNEWRDRILAVIALTPQHQYQWLTKRAERMRSYFSDPQTPFRVQRAIDALSVDQFEGQEEWRAVFGYEGHYEVSTMGSVRSKTGRPVKPRQHGRGYQAVALSKNGEVKDRLVQHLVLEAFVGSANEGQEARHANGHASDNRLANLSWGTRRENMADAARHGTAGAWMKGRATLTVDQVAEIRNRRSAGEKLDDIAAVVGSTRKQVSAVALGKIYKPAALSWPLPNLWLGVSCEDQPTADARIPLLLRTPAAVRFVSYEPALEVVDFLRFVGARGRGLERRDLHWLIIGGESGPGARPFDLAWARSVITQCRAASVPVFVKQVGARAIGIRPDRKGGDWSEWPEDLRVREFPRGLPAGATTIRKGDAHV